MIVGDEPLLTLILFFLTTVIRAALSGLEGQFNSNSTFIIQVRVEFHWSPLRFEFNWVLVYLG